MVSLFVKQSGNFTCEAIFYGQNWIASACSKFPVPEENWLGIRMSPSSLWKPRSTLVNPVMSNLCQKWRLCQCKLGISDLGSACSRTGRFILLPAKFCVNTGCLSWHELHSCSFPGFHVHMDNNKSIINLPLASPFHLSRYHGSRSTQCTLKAFIIAKVELDF